MARGTKKRYFKKNKTRNNKKIRKQRRMKKSNKSRKRKQIKKSRKRKAGLKYYQLTKEQRNWLREQHLFNPSNMYADVDEVIKHRLDDPSLPPRVRRRRGFYTTYIKKPKANKEKEEDLKTFNLRTKAATDKYIKEETDRKESVKKAAIEELYMTIQNAMNKLNNNISDEETTIIAIQNAINNAKKKGVKDEDDAMKKAKQHLDDVYRQLEKFNIEHDRKVQEERNRVKEWRRANRQQGKGLSNVKVVTQDASVSESVYPDFDDDHDPDGGRDPDGGDDDNTRWYEGPTY